MIEQQKYIESLTDKLEEYTTLIEDYKKLKKRYDW